MINFSEQDFLQDNKSNFQKKLFTPFQHSPITNQIEQIQQQKSDLMEISLSMRDDFPNPNLRKKNTNSKTTQNLLGLFKIDKIIKNFRLKLSKRAYVYDELAKSITQKFILEKFLNKESLRFDQYSIKETSNIPVFEKSSAFISFWKFIRTLCLMFILWINPFVWSFQNEDQVQEFYFFQISLIYLSIDVLITINTSVVIKGNIIKDRMKILSFYLKNELILDFLLFISTITINTTFNNLQDNKGSISSTVTICICCFVSFSKLNDQINKLVLFTSINQIYREYLNLISLLFSISSFAHVLACIWHFVGKQAGDQLNQSWLISKGLENESVQIRYCYSYYWATVTMITVGYGDITPQNYVEVVVCIIIMFMACGVFAFSINKIGSILQNINSSKALINLNLRIITNYMRQHNIPQQLQDRIKSYLQYLYNQSLDQNGDLAFTYIIQLTQVEDQLPSQLKGELLYNVFKSIIHNCELLLNYFSEKSLQNIATKLKPFQFCPDEIIYLQGNNEDCSLYFIDYGEIKLIENQSQTELCTLKSGQQFGEWEFFTQSARKCTAISVGFSKVYKIQREEFLNSLDFDDAESFHQIKDKIHQHLPIDGIKCTACDSKNHSILDCGYLFYQPNIRRIILNYNSQKNKENIKFSRRYLKLGTFKTMQVVNYSNQTTQNQQKVFLLNQIQDEKAGTYQSQEQEGTLRLSVTNEAIQSQDSPSQEISINQGQVLFHPTSTNIVNQRSTEIKIFHPSASNQQQISRQPSVKEIFPISNQYLKDKTQKSQTNVQNVSSIVVTATQLSQSDKMFEFHNYFTHQNYSKVITKYNKFLKKQKSQSKKSRRKPKTTGI